MANSTSLLVVTVAILAASALAQISVPSREYDTFTLTAIRFDDQLDDNYTVATCNDPSSVYLEHRCDNESEPKSNIRSNTKAKGKGKGKGEPNPSQKQTEESSLPLNRTQSWPPITKSVPVMDLLP
ncbi:MAG: hypothetical protein J3R72DRAFT_419362 [Linnemannia gamsii]|nr:MAG: hypothetical protein J3R72DRAFT_419362 [Linnemannia gamsii]